MKIIREKNYSIDASDYEYYKKKYPHWSEKQLQAKLNFSKQTDSFIESKMPKLNIKRASTKLIRKPLHF